MDTAAITLLRDAVSTGADAALVVFAWVLWRLDRRVARLEIEGEVKDQLRKEASHG